MKARMTLNLVVTLGLTAAALASEAETSATAGSNRFFRNGDASATARYEGTRGFAHTDSQSGAVNTARGVAVGVDRDGISLSVSNAVAPRFGPAVATNFNLSIDRDGGVSHSTGVSVANSPISRSVTAGGNTSAGYGAPTATSIASGRTDRFGRVEATTHSRSLPAPVRFASVGGRPVRVIRVHR